MLIDKPLGITSYDVIRILQKRFGRIKMGHAGTLDPNASGLLILGIAEGTKELHNLLKLPKEYEAEILFGIRTDSGDRTGKILEEKKPTNITEEKLQQALKKNIRKK